MKLLAYLLWLVPFLQAGLSYLEVASFNVQNFGVKTLNDQLKLDVLAKVICSVDVIALQEICDVSFKAISALANRVSLECPGRHSYVLSEQQTDSTRKEQMMVFYSHAKVAFVSTQNYHSLLMARPALEFVFHAIGQDKVSGVWPWTSRTPMEFRLLFSHLSPSEVVDGMKTLTHLYQNIVKGSPQAQSVVLLGDLNAAWPFLPVSSRGQIGLFDSARYVWPIDDTVTTMTSQIENPKPRPYDRIVFDSIYSQSVVDGRVHYYNRIPGLEKLSLKQIQDISDHYPIVCRLILKHFDTVKQIQRVQQTRQLQPMVQSYLQEQINEPLPVSVVKTQVVTRIRKQQPWVRVKAPPQVKHQAPQRSAQLIGRVVKRNSRYGQKDLPYTPNMETMTEDDD